MIDTDTAKSPSSCLIPAPASSQLCRLTRTHSSFFLYGLTCSSNNTGTFAFFCADFELRKRYPPGGSWWMHSLHAYVKV